jgi:murein L,D-transpeptidase YcbB/YkuD
MPEAYRTVTEKGYTFYLRVSLIRATTDKRHYKKRLLKHFPPQLQLGNSRFKQLAFTKQLIENQTMQTTNATHTQLPLCSSLPTLRRNDHAAPNKDVRYLQQNLTKNGYPVNIDGQFGPKTEQAVINFQKKKLIAIDGIVGLQTWERLGACTIGC